MNINEQFITFIENSPSAFHAVHNLANMVRKYGFNELKENETWKIEKGKSYYVTRNNSSIIAFHVGETLNNYHFQIASSHSDSPTFKVKEMAELEGKSGYLKLNVEGYGGMIHSSWFDKPLSLAGRVMVKEENKIVSKLFHCKKDILMIPNMPIHMNRDINNGYKYNVQIDLLPLFSAGACSKGAYQEMIAEELGVKVEDIIGIDLFLCNHQKPSLWGWKDEFISAPKLDDLQCAFASFNALCNSKNEDFIQVAACFDNEEVGSLTKQGADSTFMEDVLKRVNACLGKNSEEYYCTIAKSFMVSCDNAHALHPNHPEKFDAENYTKMNAGVVVKYNANQKYTTDAFSRTIFEELCKKVNVPVQHYANRSDMVGGSTLGNLSNAHISLHCVDIGLAQLAMHSSYETAGSKDLSYLVDALKAVYAYNVWIDGSNCIEIK